MLGDPSTATLELAVLRPGGWYYHTSSILPLTVLTLCPGLAASESLLTLTEG
jgi:hypothetical protein